MDKDISVTLKVWRQRGPKEKGQFETYKIEKINQSVSFLEMLDILNEQLVNEGKDRIRSRLPRGYLWHVFIVCKRTPARTGNWSYDLPVIYASFPRWRDDHDRTVAFRRFPCYPRLDGRPLRLRQNHPSGWFHICQHRWCTRR